MGNCASRVMRNAWMLEELRLGVGLSFEHDPILFDDPARHGAPHPDFNPNAKIPVLLVDGVPILKSFAINLSLFIKSMTSHVFKRGDTNQAGRCGDLPIRRCSPWRMKCDPWGFLDQMN